MAQKMTAQQFLNGFDEAMEKHQLFVRYQPKMNHASGRMIGAEALVRWVHPEYGIQSPADFIPVLEENNLIWRADLFVFESVCKFQRHCLDTGVHTVPISVNMSRHDMTHGDYPAMLEEIRVRYDVPVKLIHVEITESSAIGGMELVSGVLQKLHSYGYTVEMDDFGSGYSSLNVLKDLSVDVIKLDMRFLSGGIGGRGGTIISSMVQMAKWLNTPVIAEGVETVEQANYMQSIGCIYIQGYLYSPPVTEDEFRSKLCHVEMEKVIPAMDLISEMDAGKFWDPNSMETLIFNHFVGGAAIFSYQKGEVEILRVNAKYMKEIGMNMTEQDTLLANPWCGMGKKSRATYEKTLQRAIESRDEETCETWRTVCSKICGSEKICIRTHLRMIGKTGDQYLFYAMVQNITIEKQQYTVLLDSERRFRFASEQANVYAWEVNLDTWQMRPCFRCMRDLNVPPVVENYPEPVIENGLFPADYADMYRDWMRQLKAGVPSLEGIIPLTVGRIPFHVRYTTEFDENGKPFKAYGSATLVVDEPEKQRK